MEQLLHYVWKHRLFPLHELTTTDGQTVEVIDTGLHNSNSGPDFFNAKIKLNGTLWVGNVEIHDQSTDWYLHGHQHDSAYDNVVLHVVGTGNGTTTNSQGKTITQLQLDVPPYVRNNYHELFTTDRYPPCYKVIPTLSRLMVHSWMTTLQTERLEQKTEAIQYRASIGTGDWEAALFITLARNFGFGINGEAFEQWGKSISLQMAGRHRDNPFQIEALFMGQAGLLQTESIPDRYQEAAEKDPYFQQLQREYQFLAHKYSLQPIRHQLWRFMRLRPQNFPHSRIAQLAHLYCSGHLNLSKLVECTNTDQIAALMQTQVTEYWQTHYGFGVPSSFNEKHLSAQSLRLLIINTAVPMLFAYGRHLSNDRLCERALSLLEQLKPEDNTIIRLWKEVGLTVDHAGDSQALIQLKSRYCDHKDCLRCRFGYEYLRQNREIKN